MFLLGKKPDTCIQEYFLSTTAYNSPVHNARKCTNSLNPLCRLCQDLINNKCPKHLSFLITIFSLVTNDLSFIGLYTFHFCFYTQKFTEYFGLTLTFPISFSS